MTFTLPAETLAYLDAVEQSEHWKAADLHWMNWALGESLATYDLDGPHFAALVLDYTFKLKEILDPHILRRGLDDPDPLHAELYVLITHMLIMAAVATREERGKPPVWQLPIRPSRPDADEPPG
jgi:hypothetical protein